MLKWLKDTGPGAIITAAFIGPGTVTVCTLAGNEYGYTLLWVILFAVIATIILQEMAARLGITTSVGLGESLRLIITVRWLFYASVLLIFIAIFIGNSAFEAGNISGAGMGMELLFGNLKLSKTSFHTILALTAGILLYFGSFRLMEKILTGVVLLMSISFLVTALMTRPDMWSVLKSLILPKVPPNSWITVLGLIGTTIVPYNLFLHASLAAKKWNGTDLKSARADLIRAILAGGLISVSIIICGAAVSDTMIGKVQDLPIALEPLLGLNARIFFGFGLLAAGLTSAITAPMAAALALCGILGWKADPASLKYRIIWSIVLLTGLIISLSGYKPIEIIKMAQFANGLLLPVIAGFLIFTVNRSELMNKFTNSIFQNVLALLIWLICLTLGVKSIFTILFS